MMYAYNYCYPADMGCPVPIPEIHCNEFTELMCYDMEGYPFCAPSNMGCDMDPMVEDPPPADPACMETCEATCAR